MIDTVPVYRTGVSASLQPSPRRRPIVKMSPDELDYVRRRCDELAAQTGWRKIPLPDADR